MDQCSNNELTGSAMTCNVKQRYVQNSWHHPQVWLKGRLTEL